VWVLAAALSFVDGRLVGFSGAAYAAGMAASFLLGNLPDATQSRLGLLIVLGGAAAVIYNAPSSAAGDYSFLPAFFAMLWLVGLALQQRGARAEAAELRAARLARDREEATRAAIAEMRRLVGILRLADDVPDLEPLPGLGQVPKLVAQTRELGLAVDLCVEGEPTPLPPGIDLTAYRLIQEGLTNARKHSNASRTEVRLRYEGNAIEVEVCDDGTGAAAVRDGGHGLIGMRERVSIYGGQFEAGPRAEGGYRLRARLPVPS
jgi:signal transduction histidine kinase